MEAHMSADGITDEQLAFRTGRGDLSALGALYDRYAGRVFGLASQVLGDPMTAEEVTQDAFVTLWRMGSLYRPEDGAFSSWFLTVARNLAIDALRRRGAHRRAVERLVAHRDADAGQTSGLESRAVDRLTVEDVLSVLPPEQRECLVLAFYAGLTHRQIAEATGIPLGTVKTRIRLALKKLRDGLSQSATRGGGV